MVTLIDNRLARVQAINAEIEGLKHQREQIDQRMRELREARKTDSDQIAAYLGAYVGLAVVIPGGKYGLIKEGCGDGTFVVVTHTGEHRRFNASEVELLD